jgi:signal peptidase I
MDIIKNTLKWIWKQIVAVYRWRQKRRQRILERRKRIGHLRDWIETIVSVAVMVFVIRVTVVEAYRIPTSSMENTLLVGDFLLVNKFIYGIRTPDWIGIPFTKIGFSIPAHRLPGFAEPKQGDIMVFRYPNDMTVNYIKRCIAAEGQTLEIRDKKLYVDGKPFPNPPESKFLDQRIFPSYIKERGIFPPDAGNRDNYGPIKVPEGHYFMMGDNRDNSLDSRYWGFLPKYNVVGKALVIYFSWDKYVPLYRFHHKIRWERIGQMIK